MVRQQQVDNNPIISSYTPRDNRKDLKCGRKNYTLFFLSQPLQTDRIILELFPCLIQMTSFIFVPVRSVPARQQQGNHPFSHSNFGGSCHITIITDVHWRMRPIKLKHKICRNRELSNEYFKGEDLSFASTEKKVEPVFSIIIICF